MIGLLWLEAVAWPLRRNGCAGCSRHLGAIGLHLTRGRPRCPAAALSACAAAAPSDASAGHGPGRRTAAPRGTAGGVVRVAVPVGLSSLPVTSR